MKSTPHPNTNRKLFISFSLLIVIFILFGLLTLNSLSTMSNLTRTIYNHPLVVSNAALQLSVSITKMQRNMMDAALLKSLPEIELSIREVERQEDIVYQNLDIVKNTILGIQGEQLEKEARRLFENWAPIRNEVAQLVHTGKLEEVAVLMRGKGADHVSILEESMYALTKYARGKASEFMRQSEITYSRLVVISVIFLISGIFVSSLITYFALKQTLVAEKTIRNSEKRYRLLIESQTDLVCRLSPDGKFTFVNKVFCQFFNISKEALIGKSWQPLPVDDDVEIVEQQLGTLSLTNPTVIIENRLYSGKGDIHWIQFVNQGFFDEDGNLLEIQSVGRDITETKTSLNRINDQNILLESINKLFKEALNCDSVKEVAKLCLTLAEDLTGSQYGSIAEVNENGKFNTIALSNPGWDQCEFMESDHDFIVQDMEITGIWGSALYSKDGIIVTNPAKHPQAVGIPEGHPPLNSFMGVPFYHEKLHGVIGLANKEETYTDADKELIQALAAPFVEVIERKRAEVALRQSESKYRSMMESMTDLVYICSPDYTVEYMNPAMIERTGRNAVGESCFKAIHDRDAQCEWCIFDKITQGQSLETNIISPKDNRQYRVTNMPIQHQDGSVSKMTIYRDITEYVIAVNESEKVKAQLLQSQKMDSIGHLAGGIAHDFNNILSSIIGFTELAIEDAEKGIPLGDSLQEVFIAGMRAKDLVKQILAFARQSEETLKPIRVATLAEESLKLIRSTIPSTIKIVQSINSTSLIMGNATQINQIFLNLCTNAAQAMEEAGGVLKVAMQDVTINVSDEQNRAQLTPGRYIEIEISDTGAGIAPEHIDSIFDPYFSTKQPGEGTGLGLAMVHGIVNSYEGGISVTSEPGKGSQFTIHLPTTEKQAIDQAYENKVLPTGDERILVVDDEAPIARIQQQMLERLGYKVTMRTSSLEALDLFRSRSEDFDLCLSDMTMPNMTGDRLARELMKIRPDIPVILCSGFSKRMSEELASKYGIKAFAYKPVTKADLARTVRKVLDEAKGAAQEE